MDGMMLKLDESSKKAMLTIQDITNASIEAHGRMADERIKAGSRDVMDYFLKAMGEAMPEERSKMLDAFAKATGEWE
jgi:lipase chaperone LimK